MVEDHEVRKTDLMRENITLRAENEELQEELSIISQQLEREGAGLAEA